MGRIKSTAIKRNAREMVERHPEIFDKNFDKNKEKLKGCVICEKKTRNKIAGYITKLSKK